MILPFYHIKHKILTSVIAPHGITDVIHAVHNNSTRELLSMNSLCVLTSIGLSRNDITRASFDIFFIGCSLIHFRHDFPVIFKDVHENCQQFFLCFVTMVTFIIQQDLFYYYMTLLHVPKHYYFNRRVISKNYVINLSFIVGFTLFLTLIGANDVVFSPIFYPFYKGIVVSHIIYQELYVHKKLM